MTRPSIVTANVAYPGTFDPVTRGHEALLERAAGMFDHVILAVAEGVHKETLFGLDERVAMCEESARSFANVEVLPVHGLLAHFLEEHSCQLVLRGMRTVGDFEYEKQLADINRRLAGIETVFMTPPNEYLHVFSSLVREVAKLGGDVSHYVRPEVAERLAGKRDRAKPGSSAAS